eukprot:gnl/TRDRNA2_/TRDRNA2_159793_c3_seq1.p1 gnl/TRDRNA2_/TRDRNA2_159793_c3~~gnl/TRDRNA2_/TRDRNA2_159793_c3_seq1.p1  ORF type:complete len:218 (+),score=29.03 gnl/TRDRNA2_/TRDRNA2_159793_c3_seq1:2-655(+)
MEPEAFSARTATSGDSVVGAAAPDPFVYGGEGEGLEIAETGNSISPSLREGDVDDTLSPRQAWTGNFFSVDSAQTRSSVAQSPGDHRASGILQGSADMGAADFRRSLTATLFDADVMEPRGASVQNSDCSDTVVSHNSIVGADDSPQEFYAVASLQHGRRMMLGPGLRLNPDDGPSSHGNKFDGLRSKSFSAAGRDALGESNLGSDVVSTTVRRHSL